MMALTAGTRIYYGGDIANRSHFGVISEVKTDRWGTQYHIIPDREDDDEQRKPYWIHACLFSDEYKGHGGTRFVTEEAYIVFTDGQRQRFMEQFGKKLTA